MWCALSTGISGKQTLTITIKETENQNFKLERKRIPYNVLEQVVLRVTSVLAILLSIWLFLQGNMSLFTVDDGGICVPGI